MRSQPQLRNDKYIMIVYDCCVFQDTSFSLLTAVRSRTGGPLCCFVVFSFSGSTLRYESVQMCYKVLGFLVLIANYINQ